MLPHRGKWRRNDQRRRKRDVWTCSLSKDEDAGSTCPPASLEVGEIMVGLNSSMVAVLDTNKEQTAREPRNSGCTSAIVKKSDGSFGSLCGSDTSREETDIAYPNISTHVLGRREFKACQD